MARIIGDIEPQVGPLQTDVPMPKLTKPGQKYLFDDMQVGWSFFVPRAKAAKLITAINAWKKNRAERKKLRFVVRELHELYADKLIEGVRVWRDEDASTITPDDAEWRDNSVDGGRAM